MYIRIGQKMIDILYKHENGHKRWQNTKGYKYEMEIGKEKNVKCFVVERRGGEVRNGNQSEKIASEFEISVSTSFVCCGKSFMNERSLSALLIMVGANTTARLEDVILLLSCNSWMLHREEKRNASKWTC